MDSDDDWDMEGAIGMEADFENDLHALKAERVAGEVEDGQCGQNAEETSRVSVPPSSS